MGKRACTVSVTGVALRMRSARLVCLRGTNQKQERSDESPQCFTLVFHQEQWHNTEHFLLLSGTTQSTFCSVVVQHSTFCSVVLQHSTFCSVVVQHSTYCSVVVQHRALSAQQWYNTEHFLLSSSTTQTTFCSVAVQHSTFCSVVVQHRALSAQQWYNTEHFQLCSGTTESTFSVEYNLYSQGLLCWHYCQENYFN